MSRSLRLIFRALSLAAAAGLGASSAATEIDWVTDIDAALKRSEEDRKPVLVHVWAVWCAPCKKMEENTYRDPQVVRAAEGFVPLKVDADVSGAFLARHAVQALPTLLFLDARGREISRLVGSASAARLLAAMSPVRENYETWLRVADRIEDPVAATEAASVLLAVGNAPQAQKVLRRAIKAARDGDSGVGDGLRLQLAEALLAGGEARAAAAEFEKLSRTSASGDLKARAIEGLARAERARGREAAARKALERLRREFPDRAASLESAGEGD